MIHAKKCVDRTTNITNAPSRNANKTNDKTIYLPLMQLNTFVQSMVMQQQTRNNKLSKPHDDGASIRTNPIDPRRHDKSI